MGMKERCKLLLILTLALNPLYLSIYWLHLRQERFADHTQKEFGDQREYLCACRTTEATTETTTEEAKEVITFNVTEVTTLAPLASCPEASPHLVGPFTVEFNHTLTLESVQEANPGLQNGGRFKPTDCISPHKVAVIIPFRNRSHHLKFWLYYLHPVLQRQQLDYGVYVINQHGDGRFNKAKLMNAGYVEALKEDDYDCFVFSDVDLIPMDDRNAYRCFDQPRHLAVAVDKFGFQLPYKNIFGGVIALSKEQFLKINGFSNQYWGWGGEDDDIARRIFVKGMSISRPNLNVARYRMIRHGEDLYNELNPERYNLLSETPFNMDKDGLNSLNYTLVEIERNKLFTFITIDVGTP